MILYIFVARLITFTHVIFSCVLRMTSEASAVVLMLMQSSILVLSLHLIHLLFLSPILVYLDRYIFLFSHSSSLTQDLINTPKVLRQTLFSTFRCFKLFEELSFSPQLYLSLCVSLSDALSLLPAFPDEAVSTKFLFLSNPPSSIS